MELASRKRRLEEIGYEVLYIGLYGSQNYGMQDEKSDIDARAIVMPSLSQIIKREKISLKIEFDNGDVDVKDLLTYYEVVRKGNFSFIEPMQTEYFIGDKSIKAMFKDITLNKKSLKGGMLEKAKAFRHEYPSKKYEFDKWGFDPKQLHHVLRLAGVLRNGTKDSFIWYGVNDLRGIELLHYKRNTGDIISSKWTDEFIKQYILLVCDAYIPKDYKYEPINIMPEIEKFIINHHRIKLIQLDAPTYARQYRTFGTKIPKDDKKMFPELKELEGQDFDYTVYSSININKYE